MPPPQRIAVNQAFLEHLAQVLANEIAGEILAAPDGPIANLLVQAGFNIRRGEDLERTISERGSEVDSVLRALSALASRRATEIATFIQLVRNTEDIATWTADEVAQRLPSFNPGQNTPPPTTPGT